jgi:hypothetical protein
MPLDPERILGLYRLDPAKREPNAAHKRQKNADQETHEETDYCVTLIEYLTVDGGTFGHNAEVPLRAGHPLGLEDILSNDLVRLVIVSVR